MGLTLTTTGKQHLADHGNQIILGERFSISWFAVFGAAFLAVAPVLLYQGLTAAKPNHTKEQEILSPLLNGLLTFYFSYFLMKNWEDHLLVLRQEGLIPGLKKITGTPYTLTALLEPPLTIAVGMSVAVIAADLTKKVRWMDQVNPASFTWVLFSFGATFGNSANKIVRSFLRMIESIVNEIKFLVTGRPLKKHFAMTFHQRMKDAYIASLLDAHDILNLDRELFLQASFNTVDDVVKFFDDFHQGESTLVRHSEQHHSMLLTCLKPIPAMVSKMIKDLAFLGALMSAWFSLAGNFRDLFVQYDNSFWLIFPVFTQMAFNADIMSDILSALFKSAKKICLTFNVVLTSWPHWLMLAMAGVSFYLASETTAPTRLTAETYHFNDFVLVCVEVGTTCINGYCAAVLLNKLVSLLAAKVGTERAFFKNDAIFMRFIEQCQQLPPASFEGSAVLSQIHAATSKRKYLIARLFTDDVLMFGLGLGLRFWFNVNAHIFLSSTMEVMQMLNIVLRWTPIFPVAFIASAIKYYFLDSLNLASMDNRLLMPLISSRKPVIASVNSARSSVNGAVEHVERKSEFDLSACLRESFFVATRATWNASFTEIAARILLLTLFEGYPMTAAMIGLFSIVIAGLATAYDFSKVTDPLEKAIQTLRR